MEAVGEQGAVVVGYTGLDRIVHNGKYMGAVAGGAAYYALIGARAMSTSVSIVTQVGGADMQLLRAIQAASPKCSHVQVVPGEAPRFDVQYVDAQESSSSPIVRAHWHPLFPQLNIRTWAESVRGVRVVVVATAPPREQLEWMAQVRTHVHPNPVCVLLTNALVFDSREITAAFRAADVVCVNSREWAMARQVLKDCRRVIVTRGAQGAEVVRSGRKAYKCAAPKTSCIDPTGAGDVLAGAFAGGIAEGQGEEDALMRGIVLASVSVSQVGVEHLLKELPQHGG
mgnify:CR=1 FL=1